MLVGIQKVILQIALQMCSWSKLIYMEIYLGLKHMGDQDVLGPTVEMLDIKSLKKRIIHISYQEDLLVLAQI